ncbi:MAG: TIGR03936 family radical SAM-associated protein [Phycisphaerae bacterium]|nr:TIGR03936 family radical SAM-associated protein [Phycisphaerae bacterium]
MLSIRFAIEGDLRFISHRDTVRLFERALARAAIPVRMSTGFNPRPTMSLPLPRAVGVASRDERLIVELRETADPADVARRLEGQLPGGLRLLSVEAMSRDAARHPRAVTYEMTLEPREVESVQRHVAALLAQGSVCVQRRDPKSDRPRTIDVRPLIRDMAVVDDRLRWTQLVDPSGGVKPGEVLAVLGLPARDCLHRVERVRVEFGASAA